MAKAKTFSRLELENIKVRKSLGVKLKKAREEAGLTQDTVAEKLKYESSQFVSNFERGECLPPKKIVKVLAKMYKIDEKDLIKDFVEAEVKLIRNLYKEEFDTWD